MSTLSIIDLTSEKKEKMSETWLLWELIRIFELITEVDFEYARGKKHFFELLNGVDSDYLHIGGHGVREKDQTYLVTPRGVNISTEEIKDNWECDNIPELVVLSACQSGHIDLVNAFVEKGVRYVIAPLNDTFWEDAAVYLPFFYKLLLSEGKRPWVSYRNSICGYKEAFRKISGAWRFYEYGELIPVDCG